MKRFTLETSTLSPNPDALSSIRTNHPVRNPGHYLGLVINGNSGWLEQHGVERTMLPYDEGDDRPRFKLGDETYTAIGSWCLSAANGDYLEFLAPLSAETSRLIEGDQAPADISTYEHPGDDQPPEVILIDVIAA